jgi:hypothetical protein
MATPPSGRPVASPTTVSGSTPPPAESEAAIGPVSILAGALGEHDDVSASSLASDSVRRPPISVIAMCTTRRSMADIGSKW